MTSALLFGFYLEGHYKVCFLFHLLFRIARNFGCKCFRLIVLTQLKCFLLSALIYKPNLY